MSAEWIDHEDLHFVLSHPEAVAREMTKTREQLAAALARAEEAEAEVTRLKAGGCARDQRLTQYCAEAVKWQQRAEAAERERDEAHENKIDYVVRVNELAADNVRLRERDEAKKEQRVQAQFACECMDARDELAAENARLRDALENLHERTAGFAPGSWEDELHATAGAALAAKEADDD